MAQPKLLMVRTSERADFMRCRQRWQWAYVDGLKAKYQHPALRFGTLIHTALEAYYLPQTRAEVKKKGIKRGPHPRKTFELAFMTEVEEHGNLGFRVDEDEKWMSGLDLGVEMLDNYVDHYGLDERYRILSNEYPFQVDLLDREGRYVCTYVGQLDVIVEDLYEKCYGFIDHKTAAGISVEKYNMDEQDASYWALAPFVLPEMGPELEGVELDFIMFNILRKGTKDTRPVNELGQSLNKNGTVSKIQPAPLFHRHMTFRGQHEQVATLERIIAQVKEMRLIRRGKLPIYKSPLNGCSGMFGCQFKDMCELHESGSDWEAYRDGMFDRWEPYAAHEEEKGEG